MYKKIVVLLAVIIPLILNASESFYPETSEKPPLKLIKKAPDKRYKKSVIIKSNGDRKVLVKVKKVRKDSTFPLMDEANMITDTYIPSPPESNETAESEEILPVPQESDANASLDISPDENQSMFAAETQQESEEYLSYQEMEPETEETVDPIPSPADPSLPASNWKRHYFTLALGSVSRNRTTTVDTVDLSSYIKLLNSDHVFLADGTRYEYEDTNSYAHIEAGYLFKPAIQGASLSLSAYYDEDLIEFRGSLGYTLEEVTSLFPTIKIGASLTHDNWDDSDYDATAYFGGVSLEKRMLNGMMIGIEYLYLQREWLKKEEFFGSVTCEDKESALRLTLDIPLF